MSDRPTPDTDVLFATGCGKFRLCIHAEKLECERDELKEKINSLTSPAIDSVLTRMRGNLEIVDRIKTERDELRAEVERLKAKSQSDFEQREREFREMNRVVNGFRELWKYMPNIENKYDERIAFHLSELIETLKSDKARLESDLEKAGFAIFGAVINDTMKGDK